jgi:steroid delta-isomerase-like uncharacterized protein
MSSPETIHRDIADAWNRRDWGALRELYHSEYTYTGGDGKEMPGGPDTGLAVVRSYAEAFPDGKLEVRRVYVQGNIAIAEMLGRGTHRGPFMGAAPTNRACEVTICNVIEMRDGKCHREREYMDMLHIFVQLGLAKAPGKAAGA